VEFLSKGGIAAPSPVGSKTGLTKDGCCSSGHIGRYYVLAMLYFDFFRIVDKHTRVGIPPEKGQGQGESSHALGLHPVHSVKKLLRGQLSSAAGGVANRGATIDTAPY